MTIVFHPRYIDHMLTEGHPERPERLVSLFARLEKEGLTDDVVEPEPASEDDLTLVHTESLVDHIKYFGEGHLDLDTYCREETFGIALLAAGGAMEAARRAYTMKKKVFCFPRPPGHHAGADFFGGFCFFNNMAVGIEALRRDRPEVGKVAIVDIDVHHGNGTSDIFYGRDDTLLISTHQWGIFPGSGHHTEAGEGKGEGYTINVPMDYGSGDSDYDIVFSKVIEPVLRRFEPDMLCVDLGSDAHFMDPLAGINLTSPGYAGLMERLFTAADELCGGRCGVFLEGGYDLEAIAEVGAGAVAKAYGTEIEFKLTRPAQKPRYDIGPVMEVVEKFWELDEKARQIRLPR
jgi:acetoin utilization deacetylase AcuC-like enzyme